MRRRGPAHLRDRRVGTASGQRRRSEAPRRARRLRPRACTLYPPGGGLPQRTGPRFIRVNDDIVIGRLKALSDLEDFVSQVASFVTQA
jgi:hypothetical protein